MRVHNYTMKKKKKHAAGSSEKNRREEELGVPRPVTKKWSLTGKDVPPGFRMDKWIDEEWPFGYPNLFCKILFLSIVSFC